MTVRANSFRSALVDSGLLALAMALVAIVATLASSSEPIVDLRPDARSTDDQSAGTATNAVAELFRVTTLGDDTKAGDAGAVGHAGNRVGMAAFQNNDDGVAAHAEIYGLPRGIYLVGIGDGGSVTGFANPNDGNVSVDGVVGPGDGLTGGVPDFLIRVGVVQVGTSGAGQVQKQLEGLKVQNLVGMSVVVAQATSRAGPGLPNETEGKKRYQANRHATGRAASTDVPEPRIGTAPGIVAIGSIRLVEGSSPPAQASADANDGARRGGQEMHAALRENAQRRKPAPTPPDQPVTPSGDVTR